MHGFGVEDAEISAAEIAAMWPLARPTTCCPASTWPTRAEPTRSASRRRWPRAPGSSACGSSRASPRPACRRAARRVTAVLTEARPDRDRDRRQRGRDVGPPVRRAGRRVTCRCRPPSTTTCSPTPCRAWTTTSPVIEDPDSYGYYRPEGDGMLVGLFEPVGAPWSLDGVPRDFSFGKLPPDWERMEPFLGPALARIPSPDRTSACACSSAGRSPSPPDVQPLLGPAPELDGYFVAAGLNSLGILLGGGVGNVVAQWIVDGVPPVDITRHIAVDRAAQLRDLAPVPRPSAPSSSSGCSSATRSGRRGSRRPRATSAARSCTTGWSPRARTSA